MPRLPRALFFLFERECAQVARLGRAVWNLMAWRGLRRRKTVSRLPPAPGLKLDPRWKSIAAFAASFLAHALILYFLASLGMRAAAPPPANDTVIQIRIRPVRRPVAPVPEGPPSPIPVAPDPTPGPVAGQSLEEPAPLGPDSLEGDPDKGPLAAAAPGPSPERPVRDAPPAPPLPALGLGRNPAPGSGAGGGGGGGGLSSRLGGGKGKSLHAYGGSGRTEGAVGRGLRWLAEHQDQDGGWSAESFARHCRHVVPCAGKGLSEFDSGVTALAVLAFLGAGHLPERPQRHLAVQVPEEYQPYRRHVEKALDYLLGHQDGSGAVGATGDSYMYNHALGTFAVCEAYALTGGDRYRQAAAAAIRFSVNTQQSGGGWDYTSQSSGRNDLSITGWQIMALHAAAAAGIEVPEGTLARTMRFLDRAVTAEGDGIYADLGQEAGRRGINMVAVGLLSRLYLGALPGEQRSRRAAEQILRTPPSWAAASSWEQTYQSYYYWYVATLSLFHLQGDAWKAWNVFLQRAVLPLQAGQGHEEGSWPPEANWVGISGGRVYSTAINVLTLESYYRYEPMFKPRRG